MRLPGAQRSIKGGVKYDLCFTASFFTFIVCSESEAFESFCPARVDELLKEARALEENLSEQKERLKQRLKFLSRTLELL